MIEMTNERPQAKMFFFGAQALSNAELLSLVIGSGGKGSVKLADDILNYTAKNIGSLGVAEVRELTEVYGVGESKACSIVAAMELARRVTKEDAAKKHIRVHEAAYIADMMSDLSNERKEHFVVFCLDSKLRVIAQETVSIGTLDSAPVHPREVFSPAIRKNAAAVIVAHTHPSGDPTPSPEDHAVTRRLAEASAILGIRLLDHVIVGKGRYVSMRDEGLLN